MFRLQAQIAGCWWWICGPGRHPGLWPVVDLIPVTARSYTFGSQELAADIAFLRRICAQRLMPTRYVACKASDKIERVHAL